MPGCHAPSICKTEQHNIHKVAENFPNLGKETVTTLGSTESLRQDKHRKEHAKRIVIKLTKNKDKEKILKAIAKIETKYIREFP